MKPIPPFVVKFIEDAEEGGPPKLHVYNDGVGVATIGWGHTGPDVTFGMAPITKAKAEALLALDLQDSAQCVDRLVRVPISEHQRGALISFVFNVGKAGFERSTVLRVLNMGNYAAVPGALRMWNKGKLNSGPTVVIQGLVNRREKEIVLWNTPDAPGAPVPVPTPEPPPLPKPVEPPNDWRPEPPFPDPAEPAPPAAGEPWTLTKIIAAISSGGGAMVLGFINSPYALAALALLLVFGYFIYREYANKRK